MGKKNIFIGLSTLLLVLLLGLSTRTYANVNKEFDYHDLQNFIYNASIQMGYTDTEAQLNVENVNTTDLTFLANLLNENDYCVISLGDNNGTQKVDYFEIRTRNTNEIQGNMTYLNSSNHRISQNNNTGTKCYNNYYAVYFHGNFAGTVNVPSTSNGSVNQIYNYYYNNTYYFYTNLNIHTANGNSNLIGNPPLFYNTNVDYFSGPFSPAPTNIIRFVPYPTKINDVYVGQNYNLTAYGCSKDNTYKQMLFGDLIQPPGYLISEINVTMSYYNRGQSKWIEKYLLIETGEDLVPSNYKSSIANFKWQNYDSSTYTITFRALIDNEYVHDDCLYSFTFIGADSSGSPFYIEQTFYIIGSNTIITDGTLDISFLETGDYSNDYANDLNELASKIDDQNDLINAVEQGNINSWLPGSGDWSSLIGLVGSGEDIINTANLWGFRNYTNSYWASLYEMMNATYTVLSQTGTVALDVSFHGYNHAITSADIPSPPLPIKNTISLCLITFVMISIYKSFSKKIEKLKMIDTSVLKSEAHDDSDLM